MNNNFLRGFCEKCDEYIFLDCESKKAFLSYPSSNRDPMLNLCEHESPIYSLSAKQMRIIYEKWVENPDGLKFARKTVPIFIQANKQLKVKAK